MSDKKDSLDFLYGWNEDEARRTGTRDSTSVTESAVEDLKGQIEFAADPEAIGHEEDTCAQDPEALSKCPESLEKFQWSQEREDAIEAALEVTPQGAYPRVHSQIKAILKGLEEKRLAAPKAIELLQEVGAYLTIRIKAEQAKIRVADEGFEEARKDKINALFSWQEAHKALVEYLAREDEIQLKIADYASEQACSLLDRSLELLLSIEP